MNTTSKYEALIADLTHFGITDPHDWLTKCRNLATPGDTENVWEELIASQLFSSFGDNAHELLTDCVIPFRHGDTMPGAPNRKNAFHGVLDSFDRTRVGAYLCEDCVIFTQLGPQGTCIMYTVLMSSTQCFDQPSIGTVDQFIIASALLYAWRHGDLAQSTKARAHLCDVIDQILQEEKG